MQSMYYYLANIYTNGFRYVLAHSRYVHRFFSFHFQKLNFMRTKRSRKNKRYWKFQYFAPFKEYTDTRTHAHIRSNRALSVPSKFYLQMLKGNVNLSTPLRQRMIKYQHHNRPQLLPLNQKQYTKDHVKKVHNEGGKWKHFMLLVKKLNKSSWIYIPHTTYAYVW